MIIGIDPGKKGGIGVLTNEGKFMEGHKMPDLYEINSALAGIMCRHGYNDIHVWIEEPFHRASDGRTSVFTMGVNYGILLKSVNMFGIGPEFVKPNVWKSAFKLSKDKTKSVKLCEYLFPDSKDFLHGKKGGILDGVAEGILIAEYGRRKIMRRLDQRFRT